MNSNKNNLDILTKPIAVAQGFCVVTFAGLINIRCNH